VRVFKACAIIFLASSAVPTYAERLWEDMGIDLGAGKYMWATLDYDQNCGFNVQAGSNNTNISGNASNCSKEMNGYWAVQACGSSNGSLYGGPEEVIREIVSLCN
jgi:hypothetical protein